MVGQPQDVMLIGSAITRGARVTAIGAGVNLVACHLLSVEGGMATTMPPDDAVVHSLG